jgi:hypothetical protein
MFFLKKGKTLPSAGPIALDKVFFFKKKKTLPSTGPEALGKVNKIKHVLPSAGQALGKVTGNV